MALSGVQPRACARCPLRETPSATAQVPWPSPPWRDRLLFRSGGPGLRSISTGSECLSKQPWTPSLCRLMERRYKYHWRVSLQDSHSAPLPLLFRIPLAECQTLANGASEELSHCRDTCAHHTAGRDRNWGPGE